MVSRIARLLCALRGHDWGDWSSWSHAGRGRFVRVRSCTRCWTRASEQDG